MVRSPDKSRIRYYMIVCSDINQGYIVINRDLQLGRRGTVGDQNVCGVGVKVMSLKCCFASA